MPVRPNWPRRSAPLVRRSLPPGRERPPEEPMPVEPPRRPKPLGPGVAEREHEMEESL